LAEIADRREKSAFVKSIECTDESHSLSDTGGASPQRDITEADAIYAFVENSGRLDQILANIQTLFLGPDIVDLPIHLIGTDSISWLLHPGTHHIRLPEVDLEDLHCGIIPVAGTAVLSTKGLKWNLDNTELKFGGLVSTSNAFEKSDVVIETNNTVLWTMDVMKNLL